MKFTVVENTPGYLPESEPSEFDNRLDAVQYAQSLVQELVEAIAEEGGQARVTSPNSTRGPIWSVVRTYLDGTPEPHDLGRVVEIIETK